MAFFLATVTYAVSERYTTTFLGAITGATIPTVGLMSGVELHQQMPAFCLIVGALIGSTCFIWMGALRGLKAIFLKKTGSKVSES